MLGAPAPVLVAVLAMAGVAVAGPSAASCAGPFPIGETTRTWQDPDRGNRSVGALVRYPRQAGGTDAPPVEGCAFPVLAVGHGFTIPADRYRFLADGLVPTGVILVLPTTEAGLSPNHAAFGADLAFVTRALGTDAGFTAAAGPQRGVVGHSMGGGAAVLAAATSVTVPTLVLTGSRDCVTPFATHAGPILAALAAKEVRHVELAGGSHCQFSDGYFTCSIGEGSCGGSAQIPAASQHAVTVQEIRRLLDEVIGAPTSIEFADDFEG